MHELCMDLHTEFDLPSQHIHAVEIVIVFEVEDGWPFPKNIVTDEENPLTFEDLFNLSGEYIASPWHSLDDMMTEFSESYIKQSANSKYEEPEKQEPHDWEP